MAKSVLQVLTEARALEIHFGALAPHIADQIEAQGLPAIADAEHYELDRKAINRLRIRSVITDADAHRANGRLFKRILCAIEKARGQGI